MKFFCINLDTAHDHREHCEAQFETAGIEVTFVSAFDARQNGISRSKQDMPDGACGCYLSHLMLAREIARYDTGPAVIFEDDIRLAEGFDTCLKKVMDSLPADWDVAFLGWEHGGWPQAPALVTATVNEDWMKVKQACLWGFHAYIINGRRGAERLLRVMQPIRTTVDSQVFQAILDGQLNAYFLRKKLAYQSYCFQSQTV